MIIQLNAELPVRRGKEGVLRLVDVVGSRHFRGVLPGRERLQDVAEWVDDTGHTADVLVVLLLPHLHRDFDPLSCGCPNGRLVEP